MYFSNWGRKKRKEKPKKEKEKNANKNKYTKTRISPEDHIEKKMRLYSTLRNLCIPPTLYSLTDKYNSFLYTLPKNRTGRLYARVAAKSVIDCMLEGELKDGPLLFYDHSTTA